MNSENEIRKELNLFLISGDSNQAELLRTTLYGLQCPVSPVFVRRILVLGLNRSSLEGFFLRMNGNFNGALVDLSSLNNRTKRVVCDFLEEKKLPVIALSSQSDFSECNREYSGLNLVGVIYFPLGDSRNQIPACLIDLSKQRVMH